MFCYHCGKEVQENTGNCPFCGAKIDESSQGTEWNDKLDSALFQTSRPAHSGSSKASHLSSSGKFLLAIGLVAILSLVIVVALHFRKSADEEEEAYSIVGLWRSREAVTFGNTLSELLQESGVPESIADAAVSIIGLGSDGKVSLRFTEGGNIYMGANNLSISLGNLVWEDLGENRLMLRYDIQVSVLGTSVPLTLAYESEYKIDEDSLTLDLFGHKTRFTRVTQ